jgi:hypothetical protein
VPQSLDDVIKDVKRLEKGLHQALDRAEKLLFELYTLEKALLANKGIRPGSGCGPGTMPPDGAPPSAQNCQFEGIETDNVTGNVTVTFDSAKSVTLRRRLRC